MMQKRGYLVRVSSFYLIIGDVMVIGKQILKWFLGFFVLSFLFFILVRTIPGDPVHRLLTTYQLPHTKENIEFLTVSFGLDKPLWYQYGYWISHFVQGDWGSSFITGRDVRMEILRRVPVSLAVGLGGVLLGGFFAFFLGYLSACKPKGFWDKFSRGLTLFIQSVPSFMIAVFLIYLLSVHFQVVKIYSDPAVAVLLAALLVALGTTGELCRVMRGHFLEIAATPYIHFARCRGFERNKLLLRDGLRPALIALISTMVGRFSWVIGGTAVVEFVFAIPGVSLFLVQSIGVKDYNIIQSYLLFILLWMGMVHVICSLFTYFLRGGVK